MSCLIWTYNELTRTSSVAEWSEIWFLGRWLPKPDIRQVVVQDQPQWTGRQVDWRRCRPTRRWPEDRLSPLRG